MNTLILPACGQSSRFPGLRPKWLLTNPKTGHPMFVDAMIGLDISDIDRVILTVLREHEDLYGFTEPVKRIVHNLIKRDIEIIYLDSSISQPDTIRQTIELAHIKGAIHIKDTDNTFVTKLGNGNYVAYIDLHNINEVDAKNKSYLDIDRNNIVNNIVEKHIISNTFCTGLYGFSDAAQFIRMFHTIENTNNLYISHIILAMIMNGVQFTGQEVCNYHDWGTLDAWSKYRRNFNTIFTDLDGVLVESSSEYMTPLWGTTKGIQQNIETLNNYKANGAKIIITTARTEQYSAITIDQLDRENIEYDQIIFNCGGTKRIIINDFAASNPYPTCEAINIPRNINNLGQYL